MILPFFCLKKGSVFRYKEGLSDEDSDVYLVVKAIDTYGNMFYLKRIPPWSHLLGGKTDCSWCSFDWIAKYLYWNIEDNL